jgi:phosphatidylinositol alpha-1,6-mannosyltransferase
MPSTGEGFGIVFLEAMASGTPALGLASAGASDALGEGELGRIVEEGDLASAISRVLDQPKLDPSKLAAAVRSRFGTEAFSLAVKGAIGRVL